MTRPPRPGLSTTAVHGVVSRRAVGQPVVAPLTQSTTFHKAVGVASETLYTRYGNTPNQRQLAERYARLEGAEAAVFTASGMSATALALLAVLRPGDHLVSSRWIYGGTQRLFDEEFGRLGIQVSYVNPAQPTAWKRAVRRGTRAIFLEAVTNPLMRVVDLAPPHFVAHTHGIALLVDGTFASPVNLRPLEHGADVVITSATKYLNGHTDVIAGAVAGSAEFIGEVTRLMLTWGAPIDPFAAWLTERGMKTLALRMARHNENGQRVAEWLAAQPGVAAVHYPGLPNHPDHAVAVRQLEGHGGMVGLELAGGAAAAARFLRRLRYFQHAPSLGGVESLVSEPRFTSHEMMTAEERAGLGIPDGFLRLSCGIEDADDLIADLRRGLTGK